MKLLGFSYHLSTLCTVFLSFLFFALWHAEAASEEFWTTTSNVDCGDYLCDIKLLCIVNTPDDPVPTVEGQPAPPPTPYQYLYFSQGQSRCQSQGDEWYFASVPTTAALNAASKSSAATLLGGSDVSSEGNWYWLYGQNNNLKFSSLSTPVNGFIAPWNAGEPGSATSRNNLLLSGKKFSAVSAGTHGDCIACERAQCSLSVMCVTANTVSVSGTYPECLCVCKKGYYGPKCENKNPFMKYDRRFSEYTIIYAKKPGHTWQASRAACQALGVGWDIATIPSISIGNTLRSMSSLDFFVGGSLKTQNNRFEWVSGRLRGFGITNTSKHCLQQGGCQWATSEPQANALLTRMKYKVSAGWAAATETENLRGVACERSPCMESIWMTSASSGDRKISSYYPDCSATATFSSSRSRMSTLTQSYSLSASTSPSLLKTKSDSAIETSTISASPTDSKTISHTRSQSVSDSPRSPSSTVSVSFSTSRTLSPSMSPSASQNTQTLAPTQSPSILATPSASLIVSDSPSISFEVSASPSIVVTQTISMSVSVSLSLDVTKSCLNHPPEIANDTCSLMHADLGFPTADPMNPTSCEKVILPYTYWGGRRGNMFLLTFILNKTLAQINMLTVFGFPYVSGPFAVHATWADEPNNTISVLIKYTGSNTIISPGAFIVSYTPKILRCPLPASYRFIVVPEASTKSSFGVAAETIQIVAGGVSLVMAMPAVASQMGILSGLQAMTRCEPADLTAKQDFMNNPLGLEIGNEHGASQRGVFLGTFIITIIFSVSLFLLSYVKLWFLRVRGHRRKEPWPPTYAQQLTSMGAPGVFLLVAAFLMDSTVTAGVTMALFGPTVIDQILGSFVILLCVGYIVSVFWITIRCDFEPKKCRHSLAARGEPKKWYILWLWPSTELEGLSFLQARYGSYVSGLRRVKCFRAIELTAVFLVSTLQAAAYGEELVCIVQLCISLALLCLLFFVMAVLRPLSVRFEFWCVVGCLLMQLLTTSIMVANMYKQEPFLEMIALFCVLVGTLFAMIQALVGIGSLVFFSFAGGSPNDPSLYESWIRYRNRGPDYYDYIPMVEDDYEEDITCYSDPLGDNTFKHYPSSISMNDIMHLEDLTLELSADDKPRTNWFDRFLDDADQEVDERKSGVSQTTCTPSLLPITREEEIELFDIIERAANLEV